MRNVLLIFCFLLLVTKDISIKGFSYKNFISEIFEIEVNLTLHVKDSYNANSNLDVDLVVGGYLHDDLESSRNESKYTKREEKEKLYRSLLTGNCILFASNFHLKNDESEHKTSSKSHESEHKPFSKIGTTYNKTLKSSEFGFVNEECIFWGNYDKLNVDDFKEYFNRINLCIPTVDFFAFYTKGSSHSPELVFDQLKISISIKPNDEFLGGCGKLCDKLKKALKNNDVNYEMNDDDEMVLDDATVQKFTRNDRKYIMEPTIRGDVNEIIFNCKR
uniref:Uncharacterized protein n=1 Tax=Strongyloides papillosus TaxID=174720 RepID=A0A0N5B1V9_STREA